MPAHFPAGIPHCANSQPPPAWAGRQMRPLRVHETEWRGATKGVDESQFFKNYRNQSKAE